MVETQAEAMASGLRAPFKMQRADNIEFQLSAQTGAVYNRYLEYLDGYEQGEPVRKLFIAIHGFALAGDVSLSLLFGSVLANIRYRQFLLGLQSYSATGRRYDYDSGQFEINRRFRTTPSPYHIFFHNQEINLHFGGLKWWRLSRQLYLGLQLEGGLGHRHYADRMGLVTFISDDGTKLIGYNRSTFYTYPTFKGGFAMQYAEVGFGWNAGYSLLLFGHNYSDLQSNPDPLHHAQSDGHKWETEAFLWFNLTDSIRTTLGFYYTHWWVAVSQNVMYEQNFGVENNGSIEPENTTEQFVITLGFTYAFGLP